MTKMAKPGLTKILADIQEQVSSDDECIAHNKKIKSIRWISTVHLRVRMIRFQMQGSQVLGDLKWP